MFRTALCLLTLLLSAAALLKTFTLICQPSPTPAIQHHHHLSSAKTTKILGAYAAIREELNLHRVPDTISLPISPSSRNPPLVSLSSSKERLETASMANVKNEHHVELRSGMLRRKRSHAVDIGPGLSHLPEFGGDSKATNEGALPVLYFAIDSLREPSVPLEGVVRAYKCAIHVEEERAITFGNRKKGTKERERERGSAPRRFSSVSSAMEARRAAAGRGMARRMDA